MTILLAAFALLRPAGAQSSDDPYLGLNSPSVAEGNSGTTLLTFTARLTDANGRTKAGGKTITAHYAVLSESGDTATAGKDFQAASGTLTFAPGETSKTIDVSVLGDSQVEGDETLTIRWRKWTNVWLVSYTATGTIRDDDGASLDPVTPATLTIADAKAAEGDAMTFTVRLDAAVPGGLTVTPYFTDGTATEGTDYTENTTALTFSGTANETRKFSVSTTEDTDVEENETFTVGLAVSGTTHSLKATSTATGTITNDDWTSAPDPATVTIADASAGEGDAISFTVTLDTAVPGGLTVTPSFTDGTAAKGTDYTENTAALDFTGTAGETVSFTVPTTQDGDVEEDETFTVGLSVSGTSHTVTATSTATGTIKDDDETDDVTATAVAINVALSVDKATIIENGNATTITVTVTSPSAFITEQITTVYVGSAGSTADYSDDYSRSAGSFQIKIPGDRKTKTATGTFQLAPNDDTLVEGNESILLTPSLTRLPTARLLSTRYRH